MKTTDTIKEMGDLFTDVQLARIFADQKTFADAKPMYALKDILDKYHQQRSSNGFCLKNFISDNFIIPTDTEQVTTINADKNIEEHIIQLWDKLKRKNTIDNGTFIGLPYPYVVPGGRFEELYYWDSYFTMLGLSVCGKDDLIQHMVDNFTYLINTIGHIPNANRTYYTSRSQIPFYSSMVQLLADIKGKQVLIKYLPALEKEYNYWMLGQNKLDENIPAIHHVIKLDVNTILNRYWDEQNSPRPEGYAIDIELKKQAPENIGLYRHIRAACESGWDFSSRWLADKKNLTTICTTDIIPVDLNCMLFHLEKTLCEAYNLTNDLPLKKIFETKTLNRANAIEKYLWNEDAGIYTDYNYIKKQQTNAVTLAMLFPLFVKISPEKNAKNVLRYVSENMLKDDGLITTNQQTGQQWDAPNGWAPLQWIGYQSALNYHDTELAHRIRDNWCANVEMFYNNTGRMMEKYVVASSSHTGEASGGEYPNQDGFGWTNGVYLKMIAEK